jgi:hypothetical protein
MNATNLTPDEREALLKRYYNHIAHSDQLLVPPYTTGRSLQKLWHRSTRFVLFKDDGTYWCNLCQRPDVHQFKTFKDVQPRHFTSKHMCEQL